jgi:hypothetical protein
VSDVSSAEDTANSPLRGRIGNIVLSRPVLVTRTLWIAANVFVLLLADGRLPSLLTLRTGNAWVHAIGYHAVTAHAMLDAPLTAKVFGMS